MPHYNRKKPAPNRRQQKAKHRSDRVAARDPATGNGDGAGATQTTHEDVEEIVPHSRPYCSAIERLPSELVRIIGEHLPVESRITLALASRTMMFKSGGIGPGTKNIALDEHRSSQANDVDMEEEEDEDDESYLLPTPRMSLLELLERDLPMLTRCDYCKILHSPLVGKNDLLHCNEHDSCFYARVGLWCNVQIVLPLVRRAVIWDRQGLDADSLLATSRCTALDKWKGRRRALSPYRSVFTFRARVSRGSVIARKQLFVARKTDCVRSGDPTARDLAALDDILCNGSYGWAMFPDVYSHPDRRYNTTECFGNGDAADKTHHLCCRLECFRDDIGPPRRALNRTLRCMLTHKVPCGAPECHRKGMYPGRVDGSEYHFLDHSATAIPAADPRNPWDRVLVFTSWRDLGSGHSKDDPRWLTRSDDMHFPFAPDHRIEKGSRVGDTYEAFEGAAEGAPYVPELPRNVAEELFSP